jgi:hypothetical protein
LADFKALATIQRHHAAGIGHGILLRKQLNMSGIIVLHLTSTAVGLTQRATQRQVCNRVATTRQNGGTVKCSLRSDALGSQKTCDSFRRRRAITNRSSARRKMERSPSLCTTSKGTAKHSKSGQLTEGRTTATDYRAVMDEGCDRHGEGHQDQYDSLNGKRHNDLDNVLQCVAPLPR